MHAQYFSHVNKIPIDPSYLLDMHVLMPIITPKGVTSRHNNFVKYKNMAIICKPSLSRKTELKSAVTYFFPFLSYHVV